MQVFLNGLPTEPFDEVWLTTLFTYDIGRALAMARAAKGKVKIGGVAATLIPGQFERAGFEVHRGLIPEAEACAPDYSLLPFKPNYSITHTSRGCVRNCSFCMVSELEPEFSSRVWKGDLCQGARKILFYDNNWLAKGTKEVAKDAFAIKALVRAGKIKSVDFNQGLDCRLLTGRMADVLQGVPLDPVRFAFDNMEEDGHIQRAILRMNARGHKTFRIYTLYNFEDTPQDFYYRLRELMLLNEQDGMRVAAFPMGYQPIKEIDAHREFTGICWTLKQLKGFRAIRRQQAETGLVSCNDIEEFEYWFGKTQEEFVALLAYPGLVDLMAKKHGALRATRRRARHA